MNEIKETLIKSIKEIKQKILFLEQEIAKMERFSSQRTDSFDVVSGEINNLENAERLIGQVEGLKETLRILKKNFSFRS